MFIASIAKVTKNNVQKPFKVHTKFYSLKKAQRNYVLVGGTVNI